MQLSEGRLGEISHWYVPKWQEQGIAHGFLGAELDFLQEADRARFETEQNTRLYLLNQLHETEIVQVREPQQLPELRASRPGADAWLVNASDLQTAASFGILTADCFPVLCVCKDSRLFACLHCGWRSAVAGILTKLIAEMLRSGVRLKSIELAIGPGATVENYQVSEEVAGHFYKAVAEISDDENTLGQVIIEKHPKDFYCDIRQLLILQACSAGIPREQIYHHNSCTISDDRFFSYRRQKAFSGRQLSFISTEFPG